MDKCWSEELNYWLIFNGMTTDDREEIIKIMNLREEKLLESCKTALDEISKEENISNCKHLAKMALKQFGER